MTGNADGKLKLQVFDTFKSSLGVNNGEYLRETCAILRPRITFLWVQTASGSLYCPLPTYWGTFSCCQIGDQVILRESFRWAQKTQPRTTRTFKHSGRGPFILIRRMQHCNGSLQHNELICSKGWELLNSFYPSRLHTIYFSALT